MSNLPALLAELGSIEKLAITCLAVAGGFLVGFVLTQLTIGGFSRFVFKTKSPQNLVRVLRLTGGVGAAILVYFLLSGDGGLGLGGKGGGTDSSATKGENGDPTVAKKPDPKEEPKLDPKQKEIVPEGNEEQVVVWVLSPNEMEKRFFQFDKETQSIALEDVLERINARSRAGKKLMVRIKSKGDDYPIQAVTLLEADLQKRGIVYTSPK